jgi:3'-5' exonuclease
MNNSSKNTSTAQHLSVHYQYCATRENTVVLANHIDKTIKSSTSQKPPFILLDCEGRDLGARNGKLGLIQIGVGRTTYLVDVIAFPEATTMLKKFLENPKLLKYVWDGRSDYSELRHGHGVTLKGLVDLQLVYIYATHPSANSSQTMRLTSMINAAQELDAMSSTELSQIRSGTVIPNYIAHSLKVRKKLRTHIAKIILRSGYRVHFRSLSEIMHLMTLFSLIVCWENWKGNFDITQHLRLKRNLADTPNFIMTEEVIVTQSGTVMESSLKRSSHAAKEIKLQSIDWV